MMKKWFAISAAALLLTACSGGELSTKTVKKVVNQIAEQQIVCVPFQLNVEDRNEHDLTQLGSPEIMLLKRLESGKRANKIATQQMEALVDAGLYRQEKNVRLGEGETAQRFLAYSLTEKGQKVFLPTPRGQVLCVGHEAVEKVNFFTEPTASNGLTVTQVSYEAKIVPAGWAKKLLKNSPYADQFKNTQTKSAFLVKTNDGWHNIQDLGSSH